MGVTYRLTCLAMGWPGEIEPFPVGDGRLGWPKIYS